MPATSTIVSETKPASPAVQPAPGRLLRWWFLAVVLLALAFLADRFVDALPRAHSSSNFLWIVAHNISKFGDWPFLLLAGVAVWAGGRFSRRSALAKLGLALALSSCLAGLAATTIRSVTGRTRPSATVAQGWYGIRHDSQWLVGKYDYNSFPSGHTGAMAGFVVPLFLGTRRGKIPAILLLLAMGWSRVFLGAHHMSDVVAAALIGVAIGVLTWRRIVPKLTGSPALTGTPELAA